MSRILYTDKVGRYDGPGDDLAWAIVGEHSRQGIPWFPSNPWAAYKKWIGFAESARYTAADFTERKTGTGAAIAMTAGGLVFTSGSAASTDDAQAQALRGWIAALQVTGKRAVAFATVYIDDVTNPGFFFGWANTVTDWFGTEATASAGFLMAPGGATVVGRHKDGTTGASTSTLFSFVINTPVDLAVVIDGAGAVEYHWKLQSASVWNVSRVTTNIPQTASVDLRWTLSLGSGESASNNVTVMRYGFWADAGIN